MKLSIFVACAVTTVCLFGQSSVPAQSLRPNIVLMVADDLGYGDLSCYGSPDVRSPHIDALARQGMRFTQFYANAPECTPTRTALMTGRYQQRVGGLECAIGTGNHGRYDDAIRLCGNGQLGLPVEDAEIPGGLTKQGYAAAIFGKWHLGYEPRFSPIEHGWDEFLGPLGGGVDYFHHTEPLGEFLGDDLPGEEMLYQGKQRVERDGYLTRIIADEAIRWLARATPTRPFFLYVPFTAPHTPLQAPGDYRDQKMTADRWNEGTRETYVKMIKAMDDAVGRILAAIDERESSQNTLVIFFSDNGPTKTGDTGGLRGTKGNVYEGGIRVPCIIRYPGTIPPASVNHSSFLGMDLTKSILHLAGATPQKPLDGIDLITHAVQGTSPTRDLFWRKRRGQVTVKAMRRGDWKLVIQQNGDQSESSLYNLAEDRTESHDHSVSESDRMKMMLQSLTEWEAEVAPRR